MMLEAKNLIKTFKSPLLVQILSGISLDVVAGESIAITGRSGEGKTTLLNILGLLEPFDSGQISIDGKAVTNVHDFRNKHMGFIFQAFNLLEDFTALENVLMPAKIARKSTSRQQGLNLLKLVDLEHRADFPAKLLSGGERQRVAIARALCNNPDILFADEPSGNLDKVNADAVATLLFDLVKSQNKTLILVTHDESLANQCSRKFVLEQGQLKEASLTLAD
jgi:lipoprotein-releasing system ATP-binding protein